MGVGRKIMEFPQGMNFSGKDHYQTHYKGKQLILNTF